MLNLLKNNKNVLKYKGKNEKLSLTIVKNEEKIFPIRDFPSSTKSWFNSIYFYNKNIVKYMPFADILVNNLIKMYFNLISNINLDQKFKRRRNKKRYNSGNKIFVGKTEIKHSNNKVIIDIYTYNRTKKYFYNNLFKYYKNIFINISSKLLPLSKLFKRKKKIKSFWLISLRKFFKKGKISSNLKKEYKISRYYKGLRKLVFIRYMKYLYINKLYKNRLNFILFKKFKSVSVWAPKVFKTFFFQSSILFKFLKKNRLFNILNSIKRKNLSIIKINNIDKTKKLINEYYNLFIKETLRKEMLYLSYNQLLKTNEYKFNNIFLSRLNKIISTIYNKEIELNVINLKYIYLDSHIFSEAIAMKLKDRKNKLIRVLKNALYLPKVSRLKNNKYSTQNIYNYKYNNLNLENTLTINYKNDILHLILKEIFNIKNISNTLREKKSKETIIKRSMSIEKEKFIYKTIKLGKIRGVRLEGKGRLTKRLTASRGVYKLRYIGSLRNLDNINELSSVMLRGSLKSNIDYVNINSKNRNGSFGLKGWISGQ